MADLLSAVEPDWPDEDLDAVAWVDSDGRVYRAIDEIAARMGIARNTVKTQLGLIRMTLNVLHGNRALLVLRYREQYPDLGDEKTARVVVSPFTVELGRLPRRLRLLRELSIEDVCTLWNECQLTDLPGETLAAYELGIRCPSVEDFWILCGIFGVFPPNALASVDGPSGGNPGGNTRAAT